MIFDQLSRLGVCPHALVFQAVAEDSDGAFPHDLMPAFTHLIGLLLIEELIAG